MKLREKLKKTGLRSNIAYLIAFFSIIYILMAALKGVYIFTDDSKYHIGKLIHIGAQWVLSNTWYFPIDYIWEKIPEIPFEGLNILAFYKAIIPPFVVILICGLFIHDHKSLKVKFNELKAQIEKEISLRDMRKDAGLHNVSENATVDVIISNANNSDPAWHNTGWGKIIIGVVIALLVAAFGLK